MFRSLFNRQKPEEKQAEEKKVEESLARTRQGVFGRIGTLFQANEITPALWDELEELLIQADVGAETSLDIVEKVKNRVNREGVKRTDDAYTVLKQELGNILKVVDPAMDDTPRLLTVILVVGVNGSGKTTTIAKLARYLTGQGKKVVLAAGDTFRAAAIDQLKIWGERTGVEVIAQAPNSDPGAVVYDAIRASQESRKAEILIIDTAGRLQTKFNLMKELEKIRSIAAKQVHRAPHETLLVLDATSGQNAMVQAKAFKDSVQISGIVLTKLDSTAKGGIVFAIVKELGVPIRFIGTGEKATDFALFDPDVFVKSLFA